MPFIKKYFGKTDWNVSMVSSVCLTGEFPLITERVWSGTSPRAGCTLPGGLTQLEVCIWAPEFMFCHQYTRAINTREKGAP